MSSEPPVYQTLRPMFDHLRGPRVVLRPYQLDDALALFEAISESRDHLRPWESFADAFQTLDETRDWILHQTAHWLLREWFYIGIWQSRSRVAIWEASGLAPVVARLAGVSRPLSSRIGYASRR